MSTTLALLKAPRVVATDIDPRSMKLCVENAKQNGCTARIASSPAPWDRLIPWRDTPPSSAAVNKRDETQVISHRLAWGPEGDRELASVVSAAGGSCPLVVAADCLYDPAPEVHDKLEHTLRGLILRGGCTRVVFSWTVCASTLA